MAAAQPDRGGKGKPPRTSDFVADVVKDTEEFGGSYVLCGFAGESKERDHTRLYQDAGLNTYVDVPNSAILASRELPADESSLGGAVVWVRKTAEVKFGGTGGALGGMLEGPLTQNLGAAAGIGRLYPTAICTQFCGIRSYLILCPTRQIVDCFTVQGCGFVTRDLACVSRRCPSLVDGCPSQWGCWDIYTDQLVNPAQPQFYAAAQAGPAPMPAPPPGAAQGFGGGVAAIGVTRSPCTCPGPVLTFVNPSCFRTCAMICVTMNRSCIFTCGWECVAGTARCQIPDPTIVFNPMAAGGFQTPGF